MIKAILFDLGGVLTINSENHLGPKENLQIDPETWSKAGLGLIEDEVAFEEMAKNHGVDTATIKDWLFSKREPNNEVLELLAKLKPEIKKAIVSNSLKSIFYHFMDKFNLRDKFDVIVISAEEHVKKPDPEIFIRAYRRLEVEPSECLFLDNDQEHIDAAQKLGIQGLIFSNASELESELKRLQLL